MDEAAGNGVSKLPDRAIYQTAGVVAYIRSLFRHATDEWVEFLQHDRRVIGISVATLLLGLWFSGLWSGWEPTVRDVIPGILIALVPTLVLGGAIYVWCLVKAPYALHKRNLARIVDITTRSGLLPRNGVYTFEIGRTGEVPAVPELALEFVTPGPLILRNSGHTARLVRIDSIGSMEFDIVPDLHYAECKEFDSTAIRKLLETQRATITDDEAVHEFTIRYQDNHNWSWTQIETLVYKPAKNFAYIRHGSASRDRDRVQRKLE